MEAEGGVLEIRVCKIEIEIAAELNTRFQKLKPGPYIQLTISDTGDGIDSVIIDKIFDPYFTTKPVGKGTGMGLSIVHGIIKSHDGAISVYSEPGKGSTFKILFPVVGESPTGDKEKLNILPKGDETILFVDDEEFIVEIGKNILERLGYRVNTRTDPESALETFRLNPHKYDLIFTDMTMPKMTGAEMAQRLLEIRPDMPIILCTGFSEKISKESAREIGIQKYIEKPLNKRELSIAIREVLDKK